ncbi:hypothetical protein G647_00381 [Cladophialophora carrionii CBS 160.54]|uniref:NAD(P)-binding domain-containing protein n=1 Tax=Cladophialophora carrionii CBS 160.54 TaxID=1279043 RepID=V9DPQ3_9EURO|nr:uncharacterized protein G647_00381 [Cladophialophora carrionii CBS 160.54]ETI27932.1 hypothetical protein G647_00381 [Cladophialophora carrionii CBS 160.54]
MSASPTVAFFGATGGVANGILIHTLLAGHRAIALVRTPQKLRDQLLRQDLAPDLLNNLTIVQGNALDVTAVKRALTAHGPHTLPCVIVTGLGGAPGFKFQWRRPFQFATLDDPHVCETAAATLTRALTEIYAESASADHLQKPQPLPLLTFISTTGVTRGPEDVPFWIRFLYHQILTVPHADKKKMEEIYRADADAHLTPEQNRLFRAIVGIRPTLLTPLDNSPADYRDVVGLEKIRAGTEQKPAVGYSIKRGDVAQWVWEHVVREAVEGGKGKWEGEMVSLSS